MTNKPAREGTGHVNSALVERCPLHPLQYAVANCGRLRRQAAVTALGGMFALAGTACEGAQHAQDAGNAVQNTGVEQQPGEMRGNPPDDAFDDDENEPPIIGGEPYAPRDQQPFYPREQQQPQQQPHHPQQQRFQPRPQQVQPTNDEDVDRLPSFITGGQPPQQQSPQQGQGPDGPNGPNEPNGYDGQADRFPLHRRRRRHRGPRDHSMPGEGDAPMPSGPRPIDD